MLIYLLCNLIALVGLTLHWLKRYLRKQTTNNFGKYLYVEGKYTALSVITTLGVVAVSVEPSVSLSDPYGLGKFLAIGYTIDSVMNKE